MTTTTPSTAPSEAAAISPEPLAGAAGAAEAPPSKVRTVLANVLPPLIVFLLVMGFWTFLSYSLLSERQRFLLPPPLKVLEVGFFDGDNLTQILHGLWSTTQVALTGLVIAIILGVLLAVAMSQAKWVERSMYPYAVALQTIPIIALVPLIGFWFEFNFRSRVIACVLISLFPIITNTLFGLKSADRGLHDLFTLHRASRLTRLTQLQMPAAMPAMFAGFRIAAGLSVIGAIVGDFFFRQGEPGIGRLIDIYRQQLASERLFTAIFFSSLLGLVVFWLFGALSNRVLRSWHDSVRD